MKRKPCRLWTRGTTRGGYGVWRFRRGGKPEYAHRWAWEQANGRPVPPGMQVMHVVCDVPGCWEPSHLAIGTRKDNQRDMVRKGRSLKGARNPRAALTEPKVRMIHALYGAGLTLQEIADRYRVTNSNIWHIVSGRSWGHLGLVTLGRQTRTKRRAAVGRLRDPQ
jgi:hypothetical protein